MPAGSVVIAADGTETKSGLAEALYDARIAMLANVIPPGVVPLGPAGFSLKNGLAVGANADASAIFAYLLANGEASGVIKMFGGAVAPTGYLLCDGTSYLRATYPDLFAVIGTTYGAADGTHFNVPDLRGRVPLGAGTGDAADATAHALGAKSGTETHALVVTELAAHTHAVTDPGHVHATGESGGAGFVVDSNVGGTLDIGAGTAFETKLATDTGTTGVTVDSAGSGAAHTNMQPTTAINFIIKT